MFDAARFRSRAGRPLRLLAVLCLALLAGHPAEATRRRDLAKPGSAGAAGASFAIADFDGDSLPDFATVQPGLATASRTDYWIHFSFSLGSDSSFAVSAPAGGLQIASRDVNGDNFLDLIISTRISNEPVAVLLNDGRGNFHLVHREAVGVATWEAPWAWRSGMTCQDDDEPAVASPGWAAICSFGARTELQPGAARISLVSQTTDSFVLLHDDRGRAPPTL